MLKLKDQDNYISHFLDLISSPLNFYNINLISETI